MPTASLSKDLAAMKHVPGPLRLVAAILDSISAAIVARDLYEKLDRSSDAELSRQGITRDGIVRHVASVAFGMKTPVAEETEEETQLDLPFAA